MTLEIVKCCYFLNVIHFTFIDGLIPTIPEIYSKVDKDVQAFCWPSLVAHFANHRPVFKAEHRLYTHQQSLL